MNCTFSNGRCERCGVRRDPPYPMRRCTPGLGDVVASGLKAVGVTPERVARAMRTVGFKDCGCDKRRELLNKLGGLS